MKVLLIFIFLLIFDVFSKIYYYDKCDPSYTSFMDAIKSVGVKPRLILYIKSIAKLNSVQKEDFIYIEDYYPLKLYFDPKVNDYLLNLLKKGELISYIDNYLPIEEIKRNFENTDDFYENKNILSIMCQYFLEKSYMKTPFIAAVLGILDYTKNFGRFQYCRGKPEFFGKSVSDFSLKDLEELNANECSIGCLEWEKDDAKKLIQLYLEESKGSEKLNIDHIALAEAKMIVNDSLNNEKRKGEYDKWNDIIEWKNEKYYNHPAKYYALYFTGLYSSCRAWCPDNGTIDKIYKIMTYSMDNSEQKNKIVELKEKIYKLTKDLFGVEITYTKELEVAKINLPSGEISLKIFHDIKFEKKGFINYIIENNKIKSIDYSFNIDILDNIQNKLKNALKGKFQVISLKDLNKKIEKSINSANIQINYIFPSTLEYIVVFSSKLDGNTEQDSGVIYTITLNQKNLCGEVIQILIKENVFVEDLLKAYAYLQNGLEKVLEFLKNNFANVYSLINLLLIIISLGLAFVTGGAVPI